MAAVTRATARVFASRAEHRIAAAASQSFRRSSSIAVAPEPSVTQTEPIPPTGPIASVETHTAAADAQPIAPGNDTLAQPSTYVPGSDNDPRPIVAAIKEASVERISALARMSICKSGIFMLPKTLSNKFDEIIPDAGGSKYYNRAVRALYGTEMSQSSMIKRTDNVAKLKSEYGQIVTIPHAIRYNKYLVEAYIATRVTWAYGSIDYVLRNLKKRYSDFMPKSMLDFGTGPGTAIWAAKDHWNESLQEAEGIDICQEMLDVAKKVSTCPEFKMRKFNTARHLKYRENVPETEKYDLVVANFVMNELPSPSICTATVEALWSQTRDILVIVDQGTPRGFRTVSTLRQHLLDLERAKNPDEPQAHVIAPCSHDKPCPLIQHPQWCHFQQLVHRNETHRRFDTRSKRDNETANFSYVVIRRQPRPKPASASPGGETLPPLSTNWREWTVKDWARFEPESRTWPRIIASPIRGKKHLHLDLCGDQGQVHRINITKFGNGSVIYKDACKSSGGDLWPHPVTGTAVLRAPLLAKFTEMVKKSKGKLNQSTDAEEDGEEDSENQDTDPDDNHNQDDSNVDQDPVTSRN